MKRTFGVVPRCYCNDEVEYAQQHAFKPKSRESVTTPFEDLG